MKILAIPADINPEKLGGAEKHFVEVSRRIVSKGAGMEIIKVNYPHVKNISGLLYILFAAPKALFLAKKEKVNLIWATLDYPQAQVGALVKLFTGKPLYVTSQNPMLGEEELVGTGGGLVKFLVSFAFHFANTVAAVSSYSAGQAKKLGAKKVVIISNGIDIDNHDVSIHHQKLNQPLRIITTSSLIPRNGIDILIQACSLITLDYGLTIAGDGPLRQELEELVKSLNLTGKIKFLGRVPNKQIPNLLVTSDLFIRPSRFEGFGSSFIEAMAAGLPTIGTPVGGISDFLKDNQTGFLVPANDPKALAEKIEYVHSHPKEAKTIAQKGREFVKKHYNWDLIAQKVFREMQACL